MLSQCPIGTSHRRETFSGLAKRRDSGRGESEVFDNVALVCYKACFVYDFGSTFLRPLCLLEREMRRSWLRLEKIVVYYFSFLLSLSSHLACSSLRLAISKAILSLPRKNLDYTFLAVWQTGAPRERKFSTIHGIQMRSEIITNCSCLYDQL